MTHISSCAFALSFISPSTRTNWAFGRRVNEGAAFFFFETVLGLLCVSCPVYGLKAGEGGGNGGEPEPRPNGEPNMDRKLGE